MDRRGPVLNCHTIESVRPWKWQLEQLCQPSLDSRSSVDTVAPAGRSKCPRELKNICAPTLTTSCGEPGAGSGAVRTVRSTRSLTRSTSVTLRDTKLVTYARVPALLVTMPCGLCPALSPLVTGLAGSARSM